MHGEGELKIPVKNEDYEVYEKFDLELYVGRFRNDKYSGFGKFIYADGSYYEGNWQDGKKQGRGKFFNSNPDPGDPELYEGLFENDEIRTDIYEDPDKPEPYLSKLDESRKPK